MTNTRRNHRIQALLQRPGIPATRDRRGQMDITGYASDAVVMDHVAAQAHALARSRWIELSDQYTWESTPRFTAAVCPHDDYYYAARLYSLALRGIQARTVVLFGVSHAARLFQCSDQLVFDDFTEWFTPSGPVKVSPCRELLTARLPGHAVRISRDMHIVEHSLEGIVHFLAAGHPDLEIIPVLVPPMAWPRLQELAVALAAVLAGICREKKWLPGRDIALVISNDGVHYGDARWGGSGYAPFGCDMNGYRKAVQQDHRLLRNHLLGLLEPRRLKTLFGKLVKSGDPETYRITWCGRFALPVGLMALHDLHRQLNLDPQQGILMDYGTSVSEAPLDLTGLTGLGTTAEANFHHFVGYPAVTYQPDRTDR